MNPFVFLPFLFLGSCLQEKTGSGSSLSEPLGNSSKTESTVSYTVGGTLTGLTAGSLVLTNNQGSPLVLSSNGAFEFSEPVKVGSSYDVRISSQPEGQSCTITSGSGTLQNSKIKTVSISCAPVTVASSTYTIGGVLTGLGTGKTLVLQNNLGNNLTLSNNGNFTFSGAMANASAYSVTVFSQPTAQSCTVSEGSGTVSSANVTRVSINCLETQKKIFLTTSTFTGNAVGGIVAADSKCASDANNPQDGHSYKALLMDGISRVACTSSNCQTAGMSEHVGWVLTPNTTYVRRDGTTVVGTTNSNAIFTLPVIAAFTASSSRYWSGVSFEWITSGYLCGNWDLSTGWGTSGKSDETGNPLISHDNTTCATSLALICVEQ